MDIAPMMIGMARLKEMGFSDEAIRNALSKRVYGSAEEAVAAVRAEEERLREFYDKREQGAN